MVYMRMMGGFQQQQTENNKQQRMKELSQVQNFINTLGLLSTITPPTIPGVIPFDFAAFVTAKQIWVENIHNDNEESLELRNKAQQLMRVLQYEDQDRAKICTDYRYVNWFGDSRVERNEKMQAQPEMKKQVKLTKCRQPQIVIKVAKSHKDNMPQTQQKSRDENSTSSIYKAYKIDENRDQNVDRSNFNNSQPFVKSIMTSNQELRPSSNNNRIVELNKMEYRKNVPKLANKQKDQDLSQFWKPMPGVQQVNSKSSCRGNCLQIKYQCCCRNKINESQDQYVSEKVMVNEFHIKSPSARDRSYTMNKGVEGKDRANRVCTRVERIPTKSFEQSKQAVAQNPEPKTEQRQKKEQRKINKIYIDQATETDNYQIQQQQQHKKEEQKATLRQKQRVKEIQRRNQWLQWQKEQQLAKQKQKIIEMERQKQMEMIQIRQNEMLMQIEMERIKEMQRIEQMREIELRRQKDRQEKVRENQLLRKLKMQFSQICYQEPNQDERRVSEQIKQLQVKLNEIISHNHRMKTQESHSPNAKIVKLNLTPSRSNLHKNAPASRPSPTARSSMPNKPCRLLSKRIQVAGRLS